MPIHAALGGIGIALLLAAALAALPSPAQAQEVTLVSNLDESHRSVVTLASPNRLASGFETGATRYWVTSVTLNLEKGRLVPEDRGAEVKISNVLRNGNVGSTVVTLDSPASLVNGENVFTVPAGTAAARLNANTEYYVYVVQSGGSGQALRWRATDSTDETGLSGWTIHDESRLSAGGNFGEIDDTAFRMKLLGRLNAPATGAPTISGTASPGQRLTASTSDISDLDGLPATFSYQWIRIDGGSETEISGATSSTYDLTADDGAKMVKVKVTFTDNNGNSEALTSAAKSVNAPATGAPTISGTPRHGNILTASTSGISDPDGLTSPTYTYQWIRVDGANEIDVGTDSRHYTLVAADQDKAIKVRVSFTDDDGFAESRESADFDISNTLATGAPTISGSGRVGQTLTASTSGISDANGLDSVSYSYQWVRVDGSDETDVGTDSATYMPAAADADKQIKVEVSFNDDAGYAETLTSAAVAIRAAMPPATCPAFSVPAGREQVWTGTVTVGTVTSGGSTIAHGFYPLFGFGSLSDDDFNLGGTEYEVDVAYAWANTSSSPGALAFSLSRVLPAAARARLQLHVCGETYALGDALYQSGTHDYTWRTAGLDWSGLVGSTRQLYLTSATNSAATGAPAVSGTARVGSTLTASTAGIRDANGLPESYSYQWIIENEAGTTSEDIAGATSSTYVLRTGDAGNRVRVKVTFSDQHHYEEELTSAPFPMRGTVAMATPAMTDPTDIWSATLNVKDLGTLGAGCSDSGSNACSSTSVLSDDDFTLDSTTYTAERIRISPGNVFSLTFDQNLPTGHGDWQLTVTEGSTTVTLDLSDDTNALDTIVSWSGHGLSWSDGDSISLALRDLGTDETPPALATEAPTVPTAGTQVELSFTEDLDHANRPAASAFVVEADGSAITVSRVGGSGTDIVLTLSTIIVEGQNVTVSYTDPTSGNDANALQDAAGNDVATFENVAVTNGSTVVGVPGAPTGLSAMADDADPADGETEIVLSWTEPSVIGEAPIDGYRIEWSADGNAPWNELVADTGSTAETYTNEGLGSEVTRHYRVAARNSIGVGSASDSASATTDDIAGPVVQSAVVAAQNRIEITFDERLPSASASRPPPGAFTVTADGVAMSLTGHMVTQGSGVDGHQVHLFIGPVLIRQGQAVVVTYTDPTANDDTAAIQDDDGNDAASFTTGQNNIPAVTNSSTLDPVAPGKIPSLTAEAGSDGTSIVLTWERPADNGGRVISSYRIEVCETSCDQDSSWTAAVETHNEMENGAIVLSYEHTVPAGATRHYRVAATNSVGRGAWSDTAEGSAVHPGAPDPPTGVTARGNAVPGTTGPTIIVVGWTAPTDTGDSDLTGYRVEYSEDVTPRNWQTLETVLPSKTISTHTRIPSETTRHYRVFAINDQGQSLPSDVVTETTPDVAGPVPESASVPTTGDSVAIVFDEALDETTANLPTAARFAVTASDGAVFTVGSVGVDDTTVTLTLASDSATIRTGQALSVVYTDPSTSDETSEVIQDDDGNDAAAFTVGAGETVTITNGSTMPVTAPGAPENLRAESGGDDRIVLTWDAPADTGGRAITGYRVEVSDQGATGPFTERVGNHNTKENGRFTYTHTGLSPGNQRWYRISARNGADDDDVGPTSAVELGVVDKKGDLALSIDRASVAEGGTATWTVTAVTEEDAPPDAALQMQVTVTSADGTAAAPGDYAALDETLTFERSDFQRRNVPGVGSRWVAEKTGTVAIVNDVTVEPEKAFTLAMAVGTGGTGWVTGADGVEIALEDDDAWTVTVSADPASLVEGETREVALTARILRGDGSAPPSDGCVIATAVEVALAVAGTAAGEGIDYTLGGDTGTRTIAACAHEATWTVQLDTAVDRVDDAGETVTFTPVLQSAHAIAPVALNAATVTLRQEPGVRVSHASLEVLEGSTRTYAVSLTAPPTATVTVTARVSDNADVTVSPGRLEFDAANWPTAQVVTVTAGEDADEEDDTATVEHSVSATGGYGGVTAGSVTVAVRDTTGANVWGAVRLGDRIDNADGSATGRLEVAYHGQWGTVCDDRQYLGNLTPVLACRIAGFQTGEHARNRNSAEFSAISTDEIPIHLDDVVCLPGEHDGAVRLDQCETSGGWPGTLNNCRRHEDMWVRCSGMLPQDQTPAMGSMPKILAGDGSGMEGPYDSANPSHSGAVHFKVILTAPDPVNTITVDWATRDVPGTEPLGPDFQRFVPERATEGEDYDTPGADYIAASGTVTFAPNVRSQRVEVRIIDDGDEDAHEMFELVLSNPSGALIADGTGEGLIFNHDPLQAGFDDVPRAHGGATFTVTLAFSRSVTASAERVKGALETIGGTVTQVTGPDSEGRRFQVSVEPEGSETVTVRIAPEEDCSAASAVCDENGMGLSHMASAEVAHSVAAQLAAPMVTGVPQVGQTLEAALEEAGGETVAWQWLRGEEEIAGADAATYAPVAADVGAALSVRATRGAATAVSAPTAPVWPTPANPALRPGEEELLSATLTLGASDEFPLRMGGYNRFVGTAFGEMDETSFDEGARSHVVEMVMLNELGRFVLATQGPLPPAAGLAVYWNGHRIGGLEPKRASPGRDMLAGPSGIPRETYLPLADGTAEGVKVALSIRRTLAVVGVTGASVTSGPGDNGTWDEDETIDAQVRFSAPVTVSGGPPTLAVMLDGTRREATYSGGSGTDTLTFTWTVTGSDAGAKRARVASNGLALNGATLGGGSNTVVDIGFAVAPWVTEVAIAPDASGDREWTAGETIEAELTFSEAVTVNDGSPWIEIRIGGFAHHGTLGYASGSGSATLVFATEVPAGANGFTGLAVVADSLEANGAAIVSTASGLAAELGHDGTEPTAAPGDAGPGEPLAAAFHDVPASHDGSAFTLELRFGEPVPASAAAPGAFAATGATVTQVSARDDRTWIVTVTPDDGASAVTVTLPARGCADTGAVCTADGRGLAADVSATVAAHTGESAFRVSVVDLPEEHDGASDIVFRVVFNKRPAGFSYTVLRDRTLDIRQGGTELTPHVKRVRTGDDRNSEWRVTVAPDGNEDVTVAIGPFSSCSDAGAICTEDEEVIANEIDETVLGPPGLSVADARVYEAPGATVDFAVTLGRASRATVHVDYATSDGTAVAGDDYAERSGTLAFAPGETEHTVSVLVYQDGHDEGEETFTLTLSNPRGGNAWLKDPTAVGTIENTDAMPRAWLARFGRTVAEQMVDAVDARFAAGRSAGVEMTLAGQPLAGASPEEIEALEEREAEKRLEAFAERLKGVTGDEDEAGNDERALTGRDFLTASAFTLTAGTAEGGYGAVWGRGAASRFDGREGELSLEGEVTSVMLGADFTRELATLGLALTHSRGEGSYQGEGEGEVSSTLTGLYPYGRYELSRRVSVWGIAGYGEGALTLTPEGQDPLETDMNLMMGAVGTRAVALEAPAEGGVELSVTSDAMAVRTRSEAETGERGNLAEAQADVTRLRLGLEGTWRGIGADGGATFVPTLEVGVRHDAGDAETGFGLDVGGGLAWAHPRVGLSADVRARALLTHESDGFGERGLSGSLGFDPRPDSDRGFAMTLSQTMGAQASGGMDALLGQRHLEGLGAGDEGGLGARRLELKAGYGFAVFGDRFTATPQARLGLSDSQRELGLGWRLGLAQSGPVSMELGLEGTRSEPTRGGGEAVNALMLRGTVRW